MKALLITCSLFIVTFLPVDYIAKDRARWKPYYSTITPVKTVDQWFLPFKVSNRSDPRQLKVISVFGDHRDSYLKGHTSTDMVPARSQSFDDYGAQVR